MSDSEMDSSAGSGDVETKESVPEDDVVVPTQHAMDQAQKFLDLMTQHDGVHYSFLENPLWDKDAYDGVYAYLDDVLSSYPDVQEKLKRKNAFDMSNMRMGHLLFTTLLEANAHIGAFQRLLMKSVSLCTTNVERNVLAACAIAIGGIYGGDTYSEVRVDAARLVVSNTFNRQSWVADMIEKDPGLVFATPHPIYDMQGVDISPYAKVHNRQTYDVAQYICNNDGTIPPGKILGFDQLHLPNKVEMLSGFISQQSVESWPMMRAMLWDTPGFAESLSAAEFAEMMTYIRTYASGVERNTAEAALVTWTDDRGASHDRNDPGYTTMYRKQKAREYWTDTWKPYVQELLVELDRMGYHEFMFHESYVPKYARPLWRRAALEFGRCLCAGNKSSNGCNGVVVASELVYKHSKRELDRDPYAEHPNSVVHCGVCNRSYAVQQKQSDTSNSTLRVQRAREALNDAERELDYRTRKKDAVEAFNSTTNGMVQLAYFRAYFKDPRQFEDDSFIARMNNLWCFKTADVMEEVVRTCHVDASKEELTPLFRRLTINAMQQFAYGLSVLSDFDEVMNEYVCGRIRGACDRKGGGERLYTTACEVYASRYPAFEARAYEHAHGDIAAANTVSGDELKEEAHAYIHARTGWNMRLREDTYVSGWREKLDETFGGASTHSKELSESIGVLKRGTMTVVALQRQIDQQQTAVQECRQELERAQRTQSQAAARPVQPQVRQQSARQRANQRWKGVKRKQQVAESKRRRASAAALKEQQERNAKKVREDLRKLRELGASAATRSDAEDDVPNTADDFVLNAHDSDDDDDDKGWVGRNVTSRRRMVVDDEMPSTSATAATSTSATAATSEAVPRNAWNRIRQRPGLSRKRDSESQGSRKSRKRGETEGPSRGAECQRCGVLL